VRHHPDPGQRELLAPYFQVGEDDLAGASLGDPRAAVVRDAALLRADNRLGGARVSGLVYDVTTGLVESVVQP
jgi:carbonic anhydrase